MHDSNFLLCNLQDSSVLSSNLQDSNLLSCDLQGIHFVSCNLQDRSFLLYNLQDRSLLSCNLHDASFLFLWCVMGYWPPSPSTKIPPPKLEPINLENFNHLSPGIFYPLQLEAKTWINLSIKSIKKRYSR